MKLTRPTAELSVCLSHTAYRALELAVKDDIHGLLTLFKAAHELKESGRQVGRPTFRLAHVKDWFTDNNLPLNNRYQLVVNACHGDWEWGIELAKEIISKQESYKKAKEK